MEFLDSNGLKTLISEIKKYVKEKISSINMSGYVEHTDFKETVGTEAGAWPEFNSTNYITSSDNICNNMSNLDKAVDDLSNEINDVKNNQLNEDNFATINGKSLFESNNISIESTSLNVRTIDGRENLTGPIRLAGSDNISYLTENDIYFTLDVDNGYIKGTVKNPSACTCDLTPYAKKEDLTEISEDLTKLKNNQLNEDNFATINGKSLFESNNISIESTNLNVRTIDGREDLTGSIRLAGSDYISSLTDNDVYFTYDDVMGCVKGTVKNPSACTCDLTPYAKKEETVKLVKLSLDVSTGAGTLSTSELANLNNTEYSNIFVEVDGKYSPTLAQGVSLTGGDEDYYIFKSYSLVNKSSNMINLTVQGCLIDLAGAFPGIYAYVISINIETGEWSVINGGVKLF